MLLRKLYSSFGLENDFCAYLTQANSCFGSEEKNVIVQMDEIHVRSDIAYKGKSSLRQIWTLNTRPEQYSR